MPAPYALRCGIKGLGMLPDQGNAEKIGGARRAKGDTRGDHDGLLRGCKPFATSNAAGAVDHVL